VTRKQVEEIARTKMPGPDGGEPRGAMRTVEGHGAQPRHRSGLEDIMAKAGKRYRSAAAKIDRDKRYAMDEAVGRY
jgi:hypothetical protein